VEGRGAGEDGYVTVEAAIVFTALTAVIGMVVAGVVTVTTYLGAVGLARDGARAAALGDAVAARSLVAERQPDATVTVTSSAVDSSTGQLAYRVQVSVPGTLFDLSATAVIIGEPQAVE
jgi:Flp pilus assembly protein TadG